MLDSDQQALNSQAVSYFVRSLEGQLCEDLSQEEMKAVRGGATYVMSVYSSNKLIGEVKSTAIATGINLITTNQTVSVSILPTYIMTRSSSSATSK